MSEYIQIGPAPTPKELAALARARANYAEQYTRDIRRLLGEAMAAEERAKKQARELELAAARG